MTRGRERAGTARGRTFFPSPGGRSGSFFRRGARDGQKVSQRFPFFSQELRDFRLGEEPSTQSGAGFARAVKPTGGVP
ncbi:Hypothetical protein AA314_06334 [Archangium gephyra]|uniref:Uncharacterized protein n=1 Tax=Archangium gephyra TaxID=48 RepID=A0AAC8TG53_9BACT|nr:Hypothetical protein AA314_06334 [Archangium gephyra]